jgi:hypothetical protein
MLPQRPTGAQPPPSALRKSGAVASPQTNFEAVKKRVIAKLEDRLDMSASKRMPQSLFRQTLRQQVDQITDQEARGFARADRDRIIEEVLAELLGYGPLEELFGDPTVREVMVTGPGAVIVRRDQGQWLPTSVKFRDENHVRATLDRIAAHADPVGPVMASVALFDMKLPNGFRALAVIPPGALGHPASASFVRETTIPVPPAASAAGPAAANVSPTGSTSNGTLRTIPGGVTASPRIPGSGLITTPPPRPGVAEPSSSGSSTNLPHDPLARHRVRITERLMAKFASLKVYDLTRFDPNELSKVIGAYVSEYATNEKVYLSDTDQGRLTLEILTSLRR